MGSLTKIMLRITGTVVLLGAVAKSVVIPPNAALDFLKNNRRNSVQVREEKEEKEEHENKPEVPEEFEIPDLATCSPSPALLKSGSWRYVPNSGVSNTDDVWFTYIGSQLTWNAAKAACNALDKNIRLANVMNQQE